MKLAFSHAMIHRLNAIGKMLWNRMGDALSLLA
jgi:hypothetical protein